MLHPSSVAVDYIWGRLAAAHVHPRALPALRRLDALRAAAQTPLSYR